MRKFDIHEDDNKTVKKYRAKEKKIDVNSSSAYSHWLLAVPDKIFFNRNVILKKSTKLIVFIHSLLSVLQ